MVTMADHKIRVLVAKPGLDGHDRGAKVIARALRDAGMEVIYTGLRQTPEMIVNASLQEDVDVIGLSILSGAHNAIVPRVMDLLAQNKMDDVIVVVGGIIPDQDIEGLKKRGVAAIFQPGTAMDDIVKFIRENVKSRGVPSLEWMNSQQRPPCPAPIFPRQSSKLNARSVLHLGIGKPSHPSRLLDSVSNGPIMATEGLLLTLFRCTYHKNRINLDSP